MTNRTRTDALLLAGFCAFLFFYGLGQFGLIGADEPRYAQVAREMLERRDFVTPVLGGQPWLEKPPLYYWQAMVAYTIFGVSDWAARLPSAIDATLLVLAVYFFLRRFRRGSEVDGALIVASCAGIMGYARAASMDMALAAAFSVGMLCWWAWHETGNRVYLAVFFALMALGTLAKGPVAPFLACLVIAVYASAVRDFRVAFKTIWLPGILLFCAIALPWYFEVQARNPGFFREFIVEHNLGRFSKNIYHHTEPFWYYLPVTALALVPWIIFVTAAFVRSLRGWWIERTSTGGSKDMPEYQFRIFLCCWLIVPVIFFSISQSKLPGYILPAIPAGALLLADYLRRGLAEDDAQTAPVWLAILHAIVRVGSNCSRLADCISHHAASSSGRATDAGRALRWIRAFGWNCAHSGAQERSAHAALRHSDSGCARGRRGAQAGIRSYRCFAFGASAGARNRCSGTASVAAGCLPRSPRTGIWPYVLS